MQKLLVTLGVVLVAAGLLWPYLSRLGLGNLPGDIAIRGEHGGFYFPIVTCIVISVVLTLIFWLAGKL
jgi:ribose/xylose/arabinose/galactoside ABC-type transport system permease subunit